MPLLRSIDGLLAGAAQLTCLQPLALLLCLPCACLR